MSMAASTRSDSAAGCICSGSGSRSSPRLRVGVRSAQARRTVGSVKGLHFPSGLREGREHDPSIPNGNQCPDGGPEMTGLLRLSWAVLLPGLTLWAGIVKMPVWLPPVMPAIVAAQPQPGQGQGQGQWQGPHGVFGSATLTNPLIRLAVMGRVTPAQEARLVGFRRDGGDMRADQGAALPGKVLAVDDAGLLRLDRYERLGTRCRRDLVTPCRSVQCMGLQVDPRSVIRPQDSPARGARPASSRG